MPLADRALVVGINVYPGLTTLSGAENDAHAFHEWVTDPNGGRVDPKNALLLLSSKFTPPPTGAADARPAKQELEDFFTQVENSAQENNQAGQGLKAGNRFWMFLSGHGFAPSLNLSGVLMANAQQGVSHNFAAMLWADRLYEGGWFDDVILFQDACRERFAAAALTPPTLDLRQAPSAQRRRRFYAFSAKDMKLSKEIPMPQDGDKVRGVFSVTLLQGLRLARDPQTGSITTPQVRSYLQANMKNLLSPADLTDDDIARMPEVLESEPFDLVAAPPPAPVPDFPVQITISTPGGAGKILAGDLTKIVAQANPAPAVWPLRLPRGLYKAAVDGSGEQNFEISGALLPDGSMRQTDVRV
jgi:Caspase domain